MIISYTLYLHVGMIHAPIKLIVKQILVCKYLLVDLDEILLYLLLYWVYNIFLFAYNANANIIIFIRNSYIYIIDHQKDFHDIELYLLFLDTWINKHVYNLNQSWLQSLVAHV